MRCGIIARKLSMTRIFSQDGNHVPVTVLKVDPCQVIAQQTQERNGYTAIQLGSGFPKVKNITQPMRGHFAKANIEPKQKLKEFRVISDALVDIGTELSVTHFIVDQYVDITGLSRGKGFTGAMKRWNFSGLKASHGTSLSHRSHGSTGQNQDPGKVFKNKKMAGRHGYQKVTTLNLKIVQIDEENGLILVKGAVPGAKKSYVMIRDAVKRPVPSGVPFPTVGHSLSLDQTNHPTGKANTP